MGGETYKRKRVGKTKEKIDGKRIKMSIIYVHCDEINYGGIIVTTRIKLYTDQGEQKWLSSGL
jgi:hypothetical protein